MPLRVLERNAHVGRRYWYAHLAGGAEPFLFLFSIGVGVGASVVLRPCRRDFEDVAVAVVDDVKFALGVFAE